MIADELVRRAAGGAHGHRQVALQEVINQRHQRLHGDVLGQQHVLGTARHRPQVDVDAHRRLAGGVVLLDHRNAGAGELLPCQVAHRFARPVFAELVEQRVVGQVAERADLRRAEATLGAGLEFADRQDARIHPELAHPHARAYAEQLQGVAKLDALQPHRVDAAVGELHGLLPFHELVARQVGEDAVAHLAACRRGRGSGRLPGFGSVRAAGRRRTDGAETGTHARQRQRGAVFDYAAVLQFLPLHRLFIAEMLVVAQAGGGDQQEDQRHQRQQDEDDREHREELAEVGGRQVGEHSGKQVHAAGAQPQREREGGGEARSPPRRLAGHAGDRAGDAGHAGQVGNHANPVGIGTCCRMRSTTCAGDRFSMRASADSTTRWVRTMPATAITSSGIT